MDKRMTDAVVNFLTCAVVVLVVLVVINKCARVTVEVLTSPVTTGDQVTIPVPMDEWAMAPRAPHAPITVYVLDPEDIELRGRRAGWGPDVAGYARFNEADPAGNPCDIVVPPLSEGTMWVWLHEARHCYEGHWHPFYAHPPE